MPRYYKKRIYRKKKTYRKRKSKYRRTNRLVVRGPSAIPDRMAVKLKYNVAFQQAGTGILVTSFRANDCFDTEVAIGGHQPMGFDQYGGLYDSYYVSGCAIRVQAMNQHTSNITHVCLQATNDLLTYSSINQVKEQSYTKSRLLTAQTAGTGNKATLSMFMKTSTIAGKKTNTDDAYSALVSAGPFAPWYFRIIGSDILTPASPMDVFYNCTLTFYVSFFDRRNLTGS